MKCKVQSRVCAKTCLLSPLLLLLLLVILRLGIATQVLGQAELVGGTSNANDNFYTAGVVEFRPTIAGMSSAQLVPEHLQAYVDIIDSPEANDTDIIVFPEGTLNNALQLTYVPAEKDQIVPCLVGNNGSVFYADFLIELSCAARRVRKYLVINVSEKEDCLPARQDPRSCATSGLNVYNTNVVFDREGRVISRYRKVHVYVENRNTTLQPEHGIFETDFGVRFGHFICFDILFYTPAQEMVQEYGLTDFIFTSLFYSELPFLTATQLQLGWAWGNNVNLLAAGASYPQSGSTGTGIYAGQQGALISVMVKGEGERKLYKAQVAKVKTQIYPEQPKKGQISQSHLNGLRLMKDPQIHNYNSKLLEVEKTAKHFVELCHNQLCCTFDIEAEIPDNTNLSTVYKYRAGVFNGRRSYEKLEWSDIKVCALYACTTEDAHSCGEILDTDQVSKFVLFKKIHIQGAIPKAERLLIMPSTLDGELNPLAKDKLLWKRVEGSSSYKVDISLNGEKNDLLTFGIYAMYYEKSSAASSVRAEKILGFTVGVYIISIMRVLKFK